MNRNDSARVPAAVKVRQDAYERIRCLQQLRRASLRIDTKPAGVFAVAVSETLADMAQVQGPTITATWARKTANSNRGTVTMEGIFVTPRRRPPSAASERWHRAWPTKPYVDRLAESHGRPSPASSQ